MKPNCGLRDNGKPTLSMAFLFALSINCLSTALGQTDDGGPPPLLRGGFVQQLRSLSEDALESLQPDRVLRSAQQKTRAVGQRPSIPQPVQPRGRATLRRTHSSAGVERSDEAEQAIEEQIPTEVAAAAGMRNQRGAPIPLRDPPPPGSVPRNTAARPLTSESFAPVASPSVGAASRSGPSLRQMQASAPEIPEVVISEELPLDVRRSIGSPVSDSVDSSAGEPLSSQVTPGANRPALPAHSVPPQVSRIPLPNHTADSGAGARRSAVPATLVSTPEDASPTPASENIPSLENAPLPSLPDIPSLSTDATDSVIVRLDEQELGSAGVEASSPTDSIPSIPLPAQQLAAELPAASASPLSDARPQANATQFPLPQLQPTPIATANQALNHSARTSSALASDEERLRMETPRIAVVLEGPEDLPVNKSAEYAIRVINQDNLNLSGLVLRLDVPPGVLAVPGKPTHGELELEQAGDKSTLLTWTFVGLAAGDTAVAPISLTAQSARNFGLAMEWTVLPITGDTSLQVKAPALDLMLEGPSQVDYGVANMYRLRIKNPGTADAEGVAVALAAESYGSSESEIGTIRAGAEEVIDVELIFNEVGAINISASAKATMGLTSETRIAVLVRRAQLTASIVAPDFVYHGNQTDCILQVTNAGDAAAEDVSAQLTLPAGAKLVDLPEQTWMSEGVLTWEIGQIDAGGVIELPIQLNLTQEGSNAMSMTCESTSGLTARCTTATEVQAFSDLKLFVSDPIAPAPIGQEVCYELTLTNRGSKAADNVRVLAQFSEGIEPVRGEGVPGKVIPGQLLFEPIQRVEPGQALTLKVYAKAEQPGTHRFRAEVRTSNNDVRLAQEESTTYLEKAGRIAAPGGGRPIIR